MKRLADILEKILFYMSGLGFFTIFILNVYQVAIRYFASVSYTWVPDVSQLLFAWVIFLGGAVAFRRGDHLRIDYLADKLSPGMKKAANALLFALKAGFSIVLILYGYQVTRIRMGIYYTGVNIPSGYSYLAVPVGGALMLFFMLADLAARSRGESGASKAGATRLGNAGEAS
ncbi:MAG TPA: TRAP transporter small permease [Firmicutes bacterium]|nr:TRAP transporter small permease [Bacillota bacterium]